MMRRRWQGVAIVLAATSSAPAAAGAESIQAVAPRGEGVLTKCRSWLVTTSCRTYQHIALPDRIALGDTITVSFGSHPKEFGFRVKRITLEQGRCELFSEAEGDQDQIDKIEVAPCERAAPGK